MWSMVIENTFRHKFLEKSLSRLMDIQCFERTLDLRIDVDNFDDFFEIETSLFYKLNFPFFSCTPQLRFLCEFQVKINQVAGTWFRKQYPHVS